MRVKICGLTNLNDAVLAADAGADLLGFIFYPLSPRAVRPEQVAPIVQEVRQRFPHALCVGVFVDEPPEAIRRIVVRCRLDAVQLHGNEPPEETTALMGDGTLVIKSFRLRDERVLERMEMYRVPLYLVDTYVPGQPGGTGQVGDWGLAARACRKGNVILAGGLNPDNVAEAVRVVRPWGVDVSSGVEAAPGRKDPDRVRQFIAQARDAFQENRR